MQVANNMPSDYTIAGKHVIKANSIATFDDALWAGLKHRPSVQHWLAHGHLKEVATGPAASTPIKPEAAAAPAPAAGVQAPTEPAKRDPLDHDGDGKKGGSLPKAQRKAKA